ncbi:MAG: YkgJ family cysteine cluster protein [Spirochaetes bacterium]|nr:YkgJ family cysteine cluster protein [Spirochaetota bacterium]
MDIKENYYELFPQLNDIVILYQEVEAIINNIKSSFSIFCPHGCGTCCDTSIENIEASIVEMLPLCIHIYEQHNYQLWLDKANEKQCIFYDTSPLKKSSGCCMVYTYRPLVCRLFGFSFTKNKYGAIVPVACSILQKQYKDKSNFIAIAKDSLPMMSSFSLQSIMIDTVRSDRYPINEAFVKAMEYVVLKISLTVNDSNYNKIA